MNDKGQHGGYREGSGRKKGVAQKPKIMDSMSPDEIQALIAVTIQKAMDGDANLMKFLLEQYWGKATQQIDTPDIANAMQIIFDNAFTHRSEASSE